MTRKRLAMALKPHQKRYRHFTISIPVGGWKLDLEEKLFEWKDFMERCRAINIVWILHDKDKDKEGKPVKPHYQAYFKYKTNKTVSAVARELGIGVNSVQAVYSSGASMVQYLLHWGANTEINKHRYKFDDLTQVTQEGYEPLDLKSLIGEAQKGYNYNARHIFYGHLQERIAAGEITRFNYPEKIKEEPWRFEREILGYMNRAFDEIDKAKVLEVKKSPCKLTNVLLLGEGRLGKYTLACKIAEIIGSFANVRSLTVWDGYKGEDVAIIDEIDFQERGNGLSAESLLNLMDKNSGELPARYQDRSKHSLKGIFGTSNKSFSEIQKSFLSDLSPVRFNEEQLEAFIHRIALVIKFVGGKRPVIEHLHITVEDPIQLTQEQLDKLLDDHFKETLSITKKQARSVAKDIIAGVSYEKSPGELKFDGYDEEEST